MPERQAALANHTVFCPNRADVVCSPSYLNGLIVTTELQPDLRSDEPIRDAARFLRRIAFFLLFGAAPAFSPYSKRSLMLFSTLGASMILIAAVIEGNRAIRFPTSLSRALLVVLGAGFIYSLWSGLSLAWTPFPGESGGRYASFIMIALAAVGLIFVMPKRFSASRLYILSGGVTIGYIICLGLSLAPSAEVNLSVVNRSLTTLALLVPPVTVWLMYRRRDVLSVMLVLMACFSNIMLGNMIAFLALVLSSAVFVAALVWPDQTRRWLAIICGLLILLSPLIPLVAAYPLKFVLGDAHSIAALFMDWFRVVADDPFRLLTGHGFDTIGRAASAGLIPPETPRGILIDTWYELGLVGAISLAALISALFMLSETMTRTSAAAMHASLVGAFMIGTFGGNLSQTPWLTSLALAAVAILALERGQYKTARPVSRDIEAMRKQPSGFSIFPDRFRF